MDDLFTLVETAFDPLAYTRYSGLDQSVAQGGPHYPSSVALHFHEGDTLAETVRANMQMSDGFTAALTLVGVIGATLALGPVHTLLHGVSSTASRYCLQAFLLAPAYALSIPDAREPKRVAPERFIQPMTALDRLGRLETFDKRYGTNVAESYLATYAR